MEREVMDGLGAKGQPRSYRLPMWCDMAIREIAYAEGRNQNNVVSLLVVEALRARGYAINSLAAVEIEMGNGGKPR
jgi:hypothetical protein